METINFKAVLLNTLFFYLDPSCTTHVPTTCSKNCCESFRISNKSVCRAQSHHKDACFENLKVNLNIGKK